MVRASSPIAKIFLLLFILFQATYAISQPFSFFKTGDTEASKHPKHEVRAVWLTTIGGLDWPHSYAQGMPSAGRQQREFARILDQLEKAGINTVLLQTRIRGTVIYPSALEPWDGCLSGVPGKSPGYDALQFAVDECHKRGMELHAWIVTVPVGKWNGLGVRRLRQKFPNLIRKVGGEGYMDPENRQTAAYLAEICEEVTRNYDIDGIHLDYIRYPETWNLKVSGEAARRNITGIVEAIYSKVKLLKPWVKMSCSPIGKSGDLSRYQSRGWNAYSTVYQDAQGWLERGLMDALFPMMYFQGNNFYPFAIDWSEHSNGRIIVPGLGIYFLSPGEKNWDLSVITREMRMLRHYGMGHAFFRSQFLTDDVKGIYSFTEKEFNHYPALIPAMTWQSAIHPAAPSAISIHNDRGQTVLSWDGARDNSNAPYLLYNVYSSKEYPVDVNDSRNLISIRKKANHIILPDESGNRYYAVTAIDRYGNESMPIQSVQTVKKTKPLRMLKCNGNYVELPAKESYMDAGIVAIESIEGNMITSRKYTGNTIQVSELRNGIYAIRSLNRKGIGHRLGYFMIRRD